MQWRPRPFPLQDGHLLAKGEDFDSDVRAALEEDAAAAIKARTNDSTDHRFNLA
jgi:hypothetical protein